MTNNELEILLSLRDEASRKLKRIEGNTAKSTKAMNKSWLKTAAVIAGATLALKKLTDMAISSSKAVIQTNAKFETWSTTMQTFTEDAQEANKVLSQLIDFSVKTPFTPGAVIQAGLMLKPLEEMGFELNDLVLAAGNLKESFNFNSLAEAADNLSRALSSGVASAELFRERGVRLFLQMKTGVDIVNLSLDEQRKILMETFTTGKIGQGIERASKTFDGLWSTLQGELMIFKKEAGDPMFDEVKTDLKTVIELISKSKDEGEAYSDVVDTLSDGFVNLYNWSKNAGLSMVVGAGQAIDAYNEVRVAILSTYGAMVKLSEFIHIGAIQTVGRLPGQEEDVEEARLNLQMLRSEWERVSQDILQARTRADEDYSRKLKLQLKKIVIEAGKVKKDLVEQDKERAKAHKEVNDVMGKSDEKYLEKVQALWDENTKTHMEGLLALGSSTASLMGELATMTGDTWLKTAEITINTIVKVMEVIIAAINSSLGPLGWLKAAIDIATITVAAANAFKSIDEQKEALNAVRNRSVQPVAQVPQLAEGGIVTRPTLAMIGESGPEAVVPLGGRQSMRDIYINVDVSNPQVRSLDDIYTLSEEVSEQIAKEIERI